MSLSKNVFIVHGHDYTMKKAVESILSELGLTPIILSEQPNKGKTLIEKFENNAENAGFAVVLMSDRDDNGRPCYSKKELTRRARQNVIL